MNRTLKFRNVAKSQFLPTLKERVANYFQEKNISQHANGHMVFKTVFFLAGALALYLLILLSVLPLWGSLIGAMGLGVMMAFIGFNICHDALHGAYSTSKRVNKTLGFIFNIIGANAYLWNIQHNIVHHSYTNIVDHDEDIEIAPGLIRLNPEEKANKLQRFQHIYAFFLYGLTTLSWFFRKDYLKFFKNEIGDSHINKHPRIEYFNLFFYKAIYYFLFIVLPLLVMGLTAGQFIIGFLAMHLVEGLVLGLVFQVAHVVQNTEIRHAQENNSIDDAWAEHQLRTTANFSPGNRLAGFLCGGLNMQVEHHLFPRICHVHYRKIAGIVKQTAAEFNLPYHENKTFFAALRSHYRLLKSLGRPVPVIAK